MNIENYRFVDWDSNAIDLRSGTFVLHSLHLLVDLLRHLCGHTVELLRQILRACHESRLSLLKRLVAFYARLRLVDLTRDGVSYLINCFIKKFFCFVLWRVSQFTFKLSLKKKKTRKQ